MATMLDASEQADSNLAGSDGPNDHLKASCRGAEEDILPKRVLLFDTWLLVNSVLGKENWFWFVDFVLL